MSFTRTQQKCKAYEKTVYPVELLSADGISYHKSCFRCSHCKGTLKGTRCSFLNRHGVHLLGMWKFECSCGRVSSSSFDHPSLISIWDLPSELCPCRGAPNHLEGLLRVEEHPSFQPCCVTSSLGIYGRMGDLGAIDAKYDVVISTACAGLDYIVVEETAAAQACVELLRSQNLGVATFMILEKQSNYLPRLREKIVTLEGVPRLFDLIKVRDERMKLAFYAALRNTIVAKDIDQVGPLMLFWLKIQKENFFSWQFLGNFKHRTRQHGK